jgi:spore maturation protein CgeB
MARMGYCPSGRLFEAAACGTAIVTDEWAGLDAFFQPGVEILVARDTKDVIAAMQLPRDEITHIARAGRQRVLDSHTAAHRATELEAILDSALDKSHQNFQTTASWMHRGPRNGRKHKAWSANSR